LHLLPFVQSRLAAGRWTLDYQPLFTFAWRNIIGLAEATLFTALLWAILGLWQTLFHMLGIDFFRELFTKPIFVYPVTAIAFGCALHLIGSIDRLVSAVLEQVLNVLKWLATVAGVLLTLFTIALIARLPGLVYTGHRAIGAGWLLWLVAVVVLFLNAAYRDGRVERPYPKGIAQALRFCVPLMVVVAATAFYALMVRTEHYGLTLERVWAFIVASAALIYALGYAAAAFRKGPWLGAIARVNVIVALALLVAVGLALTPVLSPYRLAANSQYQLVLEGRYEPPDPKARGTAAFAYLRDSAGEYGRRKLELLSKLQNHPDAARLREWAAQALKQKSPWERQFPPSVDPKDVMARLAIYPAGRALEGDLAQTLGSDWASRSFFAPNYPGTVAGIFADLDGDGVDEFILLAPGGGPVYRNRSGHWVHIGQAYWRRPMSAPGGLWDAIHAELDKGAIAVTEPEWKDLSVGTYRFRIDSQP
jgi:hypothetical protein